MRIIRQKYAQRFDRQEEYMNRMDVELTHLRDEIPNNVELHAHDFYELCFVVSGGNIQYKVEDQLYPLHLGDVYIVDCFCKHGTSVDRIAIYDRILIWISPGFIEELSTLDTDLSYCFKEALPQRKNVIRLRQRELEHFKETLTKLEKAYFGLDKGNDVLIKIYISELLIILNRSIMGIYEEPIEDAIKMDAPIGEVLKYINDNLNDDLTLDSLAEKFFINKYYLMRIFKKNIGYTLHKYIMMRRFEMAKKCLAEGMHPSHVSLRCGFENYATFSQGFAKWYGITPKQYIKQLIFYPSKQTPL